MQQHVLICCTATSWSVPLNAQSKAASSNAELADDDWPNRQKAKRFTGSGVRTLLLVADSSNSRVMQWVVGEAAGTVVAGGNGEGARLDQLGSPEGLFVERDGSVVVADSRNQRVVRWPRGALRGGLCAGGVRFGLGMERLAFPVGCAPAPDMLGVLVADRNRHRVVQWLPEVKQAVQALGQGQPGSGPGQLSSPAHVAAAHHGAVLIADRGNHRIVRWHLSEGSAVVAGGRGPGSRLDQLDSPVAAAMQPDGSVVIVDCGNSRVVSWGPEAGHGRLVAAGRGRGPGLDQLDGPAGIALGPGGAVFVADAGNHRVIQWLPGEAIGRVVAGGTGPGSRRDQLDAPSGVAVLVSVLWSPERHASWPRSSRRLVRLLLLCQLRDAGLAALGGVLLTRVLPALLPDLLLLPAESEGTKR